MERVVIVVPIYKEDLNEAEKISLRQLKKILGRYPICFLLPEKFKNGYLEWQADFVEFFSDDFFTGLPSYSHLLLSKEFYERFIYYEFLLIYQLDAFVFSDRLEEFCSLNIDYIGAPEPKAFATWHTIGCYVGNGGFSLRKIDNAIKVIEKKEEICKDHPLENVLLDYEDLFFAFCSTKKELEFSVASIRTALEFAIDFDVSHCYRFLDRKLPFGCHGWCRRNFAVWKPIIEKYGYSLEHVIPDDNLLGDSKHIRWTGMRTYLLKRIMRDGQREKFIAICKELIHWSCEVAIWGYGEEGKHCLDFLAKGNINVNTVYDSKFTAEYRVDRITFKEPMDFALKLKNQIIFISTAKYELEIKHKLETLKLVEEKNFIFFSDFEKRVFSKFYNKVEA